MDNSITLTCADCSKTFDIQIKQYKHDRIEEDYKPICLVCKPPRQENKQNVNCAMCGKEFKKLPKEIKRSKNDFCSRSCSAKYHNANRIETNFYVKGKKKEAPCVVCNTVIAIGANAASDKAVCEQCKDVPKTINCSICGNAFNVFHNSIADKCNICYPRIDSKLFIRTNCKDCNKEIEEPTNRRHFCDACLAIHRIEMGKKGGLASASKQVRRSKNEIYFSELCEQHFRNVLNNEPYFESKVGKWDADVILPDYKIAVLWNGIWHYKKVKAKHSLLQVQTRDKIKLDVIRDNGFEPYVIVDMGAADKKFVEDEFEKFKAFMLTKSIH